MELILHLNKMLATSRSRNLSEGPFLHLSPHAIGWERWCVSLMVSCFRSSLQVALCLPKSLSLSLSFIWPIKEIETSCSGRSALLCVLAYRHSRLFSKPCGELQCTGLFNVQSTHQLKHWNMKNKPSLNIELSKLALESGVCQCKTHSCYVNSPSQFPDIDGCFEEGAVGLQKRDYKYRLSRKGSCWTGGDG